MPSLRKFYELFSNEEDYSKKYKSQTNVRINLEPLVKVLNFPSILKNFIPCKRFVESSYVYGKDIIELIKNFQVYFPFDPFVEDQLEYSAPHVDNVKDSFFFEDDNGIEDILK